MAPQDKKWDDSAERDLCVAIILGNQDTSKSRQNWPRIAEIMDGLGYSFTKDAMSQHFTKTILKEFKARHPSATTATSDSPPLSARKPKASGKTTTPSKKRTKKSAQDPPNAKGKLPDMRDDEEDDDFDYDSTPCKRVKKEEKGIVLKKEETTTETSSAAVDNEEAFYAWAAKVSSAI